MTEDFRSKLPAALYTAEQTRSLDQCAIQDHGIPGLSLMEKAGKACFDILLEKWPDCSSIAVCCGSGNNAGDGYVIADLANSKGIKVNIFQLGDFEKLQGDALICAERVQSLPRLNIHSANGIEQFREGISDFDVVVDALLGTGLKGQVKSEYAKAIETINQSNKKVLSVDVPSGLSADTGIPLGCAVEADVTVTFIGLKQGLLTGQGPSYAGEVFFNDLGVPEAIYQAVPPSVFREDYSGLSKILKPRKRSSHKGSFGHVLIVGGNYGMAGAVLMAGMSAMRAGAGMVTIATRPEHCAMITSRQPELMVRGIEKVKDLQPMLERATTIVLGPGLGGSQKLAEKQGEITQSWSQELFDFLLEQDLPMVIDADGLNLLSRKIPKQKKDNWILTPHPGEAGRLLSCSTAAVEANRFEAADKIQQIYGGVLVLKGAGSLVSAEFSGQKSCSLSCSVISAGNPGMATAGMGDVLSGVIGGLLVQGLSLMDAARLGVAIHGRAADRLAGKQGERGMMATDLLAEIRMLVNP